MRTLPATSPRPELHPGGDIHSGDDGRSLLLAVVATTEDGTRAALAAAREFGIGLDPHIVLFAPHVVPYPQPLDHRARAVRGTADRFRRLAEEADTVVLVHVCVCRPDTAHLEALLPADGTVLVGGTCGRWRRSRAQRLAEHLTRRGHHVLFIDERAHARRGQIAP